MDSIQGAMRDVVFQGEAFSTPIPYSIMYMPWEANEVRVYRARLKRRAAGCVNTAGKLRQKW